MFRFFRRFRLNRSEGGGTFRHVVTLLSGTTLAQLISVLATIPLARLYSPKDFGLFAIAQAIVLVGTSLASLRYDVAIVLPEQDDDARNLHRLASRIIGVVSTVLAVVLLLAHKWLGDYYENATFGAWLICCAVIVYAMAQIANTQNWLIRTKRFATIAQNRIVASVAMVAGQLMFAPLVGGVEGLLLGMLLGQLVAFAILEMRTKDVRKVVSDDAASLKELAIRYRRMPLLNAPNVVVDGIRNAGINWLVGGIALDGLGQYSLANRAAQAPVFLVNGAIAQVFFQKMAVTRPGGMLPLVRSLLARVAIFSVPAFALLYWLAPWLFPFLFGDEWAQAGVIAQLLMPWLFMNTFTSPLANVFVTAERQGLLLAFAIVYAVVPLLFLALTGLPLLGAVQVLGLLMAGLLGVMLILALCVAWQYDRRPLVAD